MDEFGTCEKLWVDFFIVLGQDFVSPKGIGLLNFFGAEGNTDKMGKFSFLRL